MVDQSWMKRPTDGILEKMCMAHHLVRSLQGYTTANWHNLQERNREEYRKAMRAALWELGDLMKSSGEPEE